MIAILDHQPPVSNHHHVPPIAIPYFSGSTNKQPMNPQTVSVDWRNSGSRSWQQNPKPVHQSFVHDSVNAVTTCQTDIAFITGWWMSAVIYCSLWPSEHGGVMKRRGITLCESRVERAWPALLRRFLRPLRFNGDTVARRGPHNPWCQNQMLIGAGKHVCKNIHASIADER